MEADKLLKAIKELKEWQNIEKQKIEAKYEGRTGYQDYYTGYMSALSTVEGIIAEMEGDNEADRRDSEKSQTTQYKDG